MANETTAFRVDKKLAKRIQILAKKNLRSAQAQHTFLLHLGISAYEKGTDESK